MPSVQLLDKFLHGTPFLSFREHEEEDAAAAEAKVASLTSAFMGSWLQEKSSGLSPIQL